MWDESTPKLLRMSKKISSSEWSPKRGSRDESGKEVHGESAPSVNNAEADGCQLAALGTKPFQAHRTLAGAQETICDCLHQAARIRPTSPEANKSEPSTPKAWPVGVRWHDGALSGATRRRESGDTSPLSKHKSATESQSTKCWLRFHSAQLALRHSQQAAHSKYATVFMEGCT